MELITCIFDWIYRKRCYCCGSSTENIALCSRCYERLRFRSFSVDRIIDGANIYCAGVYDGDFQKIIRGLKYHRKKELGYYVAKFMYEYFVNLNLDKNFLVVPTPMYIKRRRKRGYNHMDIIAEEFCNLTNFRLEPLLNRVKDTRPQYKLTESERAMNLSGAFSVDMTRYQGESVLLLDDICTTGSTFENMIKTLHESGIEDITCLSATRTFC